MTIRSCARKLRVLYSNLCQEMRWLLYHTSVVIFSVHDTGKEILGQHVLSVLRVCGFNSTQLSMLVTYRPLGVMLDMTQSRVSIYPTPLHLMRFKMYGDRAIVHDGRLPQFTRAWSHMTIHVVMQFTKACINMHLVLHVHPKPIHKMEENGVFVKKDFILQHNSNRRPEPEVRTPRCTGQKHQVSTNYKEEFHCVHEIRTPRRLRATCNTATCNTVTCTIRLFVFNYSNQSGCSQAQFMV